ncbi:hypothetical protein UFOVP746_43 [uncultured Caudovirales phage]|uniref:Uncharacterized protein n=1 Tax=uncultured Caudovirales phage TaxID=2100421 RepID=A0A6J7X712_9CAUD|nr:hypothetical protein UFOVP746_43 [uncultured Caudovirales phage]
MSQNDQNLISQMIAAGKFDSIYDFIQTLNRKKLEQAIEYLGEKYCLHPVNVAKKFDEPIADELLFFKGKVKQEPTKKQILTRKEKQIMKMGENLFCL